MISIIIPYHNEGKDFIKATLKSLEDTINIKHEIIIIDDCSDVPLKLNGQVVRHERNKGVGAAFDTGAKRAKYDRLFLMGSDIRFIKNKWAIQIVREIDRNSESFTCTKCVGINKDNMDMEKRVHLGRNGATILIFHDKKSHPKKAESFRNIIEAQWLPAEKDTKDSYKIPCILGAAYGVSKAWYNHVDGFAGHKTWGTLEPYISLKSWLFGGSCRVAPRIRTGHIFKAIGTHNIPLSHVLYNKLFVASVLFGTKDRDRLINFLGTNSTVNVAKALRDENIDYINRKRTEYKAKTKIKIEDFCKQWNIDFRNNG